MRCVIATWTWAQKCLMWTQVRITLSVIPLLRLESPSVFNERIKTSSMIKFVQIPFQNLLLRLRTCYPLRSNYSGKWMEGHSLFADKVLLSWRNSDDQSQQTKSVSLQWFLMILPVSSSFSSNKQFENVNVANILYSKFGYMGWKYKVYPSSGPKHHSPFPWFYSWLCFQQGSQHQ